MLVTSSVIPTGGATGTQAPAAYQQYAYTYQGQRPRQVFRPPMAVTTLPSPGPSIGATVIRQNPPHQSTGLNTDAGATLIHRASATSTTTPTASMTPSMSPAVTDASQARLLKTTIPQRPSLTPIAQPRPQLVPPQQSQFLRLQMPTQSSTPGSEAQHAQLISMDEKGNVVRGVPVNLVSTAQIIRPPQPVTVQSSQQGNAPKYVAVAQSVPQPQASKTSGK